MPNIKFDTTLSISNIIQILVLVLAGFSAFYTFDKRITLVEHTLHQIADYDGRLDDLENRVLILEQL